MAFKNLIYFFAVIVTAGLLTSCGDDDTGSGEPTNFTVTIESVNEVYSFLNSGVFNTPDGKTEAGPSFPGEAYSFEFNAAPGQYLTFATMVVQTNDVFLAPDGVGIALYENGAQRSGDITSELLLWDAGTEINETPGMGANQAPRQSGPNTGSSETENVRLITDVNDGFSYPTSTEIARVILEPVAGDNTRFKVTIENISGSSDLPGPFSPGAYVVHTDPDPIFTEGQPDRGEGLEGIAEDGTAGPLGDVLAAETGVTSPVSPGIYAVHNISVKPLFEEGNTDRGDGLENIAEDGDPSFLSSSLSGNGDVSDSGIFNTPVGASGPAPAFPGDSYSFSFTAEEGDYLSFATMYIQSNDLFLGPDDDGISLFSNGSPISGDITSQIELWEGGTEVNEYPGAGPNQAPRQSGPDTGTAENIAITEVNDGFNYPSVGSVIRVTITAN